MQDADAMKRPHWSTVAVRSGGRRLRGAARLVALYRWQRREPLHDVAFFDAAETDRELANDPVAIDWTDFPTPDAIDAMGDGRAT
jgi:hypothetical protein